MCKFWFVYLAKALVVFPGGFGTIEYLKRQLEELYLIPAGLEQIKLT
jgi:predicted Rossmann-fold nucleotide-binding protein